MTEEGIQETQTGQNGMVNRDMSREELRHCGVPNMSENDVRDKRGVMSDDIGGNDSADERNCLIVGKA